MDNIRLKIADITVAIRFDPADVNACVFGSRRFIAPEADPDVRIRTLWGDCAEVPIGERIFDSSALWQLYGQNGARHFRFTSQRFGSRPYKTATFDAMFTSGEIRLCRAYFPSGCSVDPLEYPLGELLWVHLLGAGRGVEVHSCGVLDAHGNGHLFVGQSEAGKTTIARQWKKEKGVNILSDDRMILRKMGDKFWMYGTPWHGEEAFASPKRAPIKGIYFLRKGPRNELTNERPAQAAGRLFACSFPLFYDPEALHFTLRLFEDVVKEVPCFKLSFVPDGSVVEFVQSLRH